MGRAIKYRFGTTTAFILALLLPGGAEAEPRQYCVSCTGPDQTYLCSVDTPGSNPSDKGLQLYCIIRTSKDGGHRSCAVGATPLSACVGPVKAYTFHAPAIPEQVKEAVSRFRDRTGDSPTEESSQPRKGGEPETLIDLTNRAVGASKEGLKNTGQAVGGAASATTGKVGQAARGVGKGVAKTAGKVGSATKKTGGAVGSAAKTAWDCMKSLFRDCGSSE